MTRKAIQFRLRSLFILTAIVAVGCWAGPPIVREVRARISPAPLPISDICGGTEVKGEVIFIEHHDQWPSFDFDDDHFDDRQIGSPGHSVFDRFLEELSEDGPSAGQHVQLIEDLAPLYKN